MKFKAMARVIYVLNVIISLKRLMSLKLEAIINHFCR